MQKVKLKLQTPKIGRYFNLFTLLICAISLSYILMNWSSFPDLVPSHYNALGEPDDWSNKWFIFVPLLIGFVLWIGMYFLEKNPHLHNYSGLTESNIESLYKNSMLTINFIKNELLLMFSFSSLDNVRVAMGNKSLLGAWELPVVFILLLGTVAFFVVRSIKIK
ncbi:hypothetical protein AM501_06725 [Aneurinibacillus migulanus]|uniref:DUF1648 domain-containing protein n=1 Tax=Aneurinibacillus migulanus TaxID=47500 RepID=UPI0006B44208|nr:DUF1648 domain-containing protein [Aneurinibacillus migulanus]KPD09019.1 hypothetical protein AM501_06725 [Aneurinibacillus migulanus]